MMMRAVLLVSWVLMMVLMCAGARELEASRPNIESASNVREVVRYVDGETSVVYGSDNVVAGVRVDDGPGWGDWSNMSLWFGLGFPGFPLVTMDSIVIGQGSNIFRCNLTAGGVMELVPIPLVGESIPPECLFQVQRDSGADNRYRMRVSTSIIGVQFWYPPSLSCHGVEGTLIGFIASNTTEESNHSIPAKIRSILNAR